MDRTEPPSPSLAGCATAKPPAAPARRRRRLTSRHPGGPAATLQAERLRQAAAVLRQERAPGADYYPADDEIIADWAAARRTGSDDPGAWPEQLDRFLAYAVQEVTLMHDTADIHIEGFGDFGFRNAALNRTPEDLALLKEACAALEATPDGAEFGRCNLAWHYCVAAASHNELLVAFLSSISSAIVRESDAHAKAFEADSLGEIRSAVIHAHQSITDAVVRGQADAAKRRMERHLNAYAATIDENESESVDVG